jgi:hypothetical protein
MRNLIQRLLDTYEVHDEFKRQLENYHNYIQSEDGRFAHDVFKTSRLAIMSELLSARYTKLPAGTKDVQQRVFYELDRMFDFLMAPMRMVNEKRAKRTAIYNPKAMGAKNSNPTRKGTKHGR